MKDVVLKVISLFIFTLLLSACGNQPKDEVKLWVEQEKSNIFPHVKPVEAMAVFYPATFNWETAISPFDDARVIGDERKFSNNNSQIMERHRNRRKEVLESYPLDTLKMVGFLQKNNKPTALLLVENRIYQVTIGNYLGQNLGVIESINESGISLKEVVQDSAGDWQVRLVKLELQADKE